MPQHALPRLRSSEFIPTWLLALIVAAVVGCASIWLNTQNPYPTHFKGQPSDEQVSAVATIDPASNPRANASTAKGLHLFLLPHPDDELSGLTSLLESHDTYPVIVLFTQGEQTAYCNPEAYEKVQVDELGAIRPSVDPTGKGTDSCKQARLSSFTTSWQMVSDHFNLALPSLQNLQETEIGQFSAQHVENDHGAFIIFDLGDSHLDHAQALQATRSVLENQNAILPDLPLTRVTASSYVGPEEQSHASRMKRCEPTAFCPLEEEPFPYQHDDHKAVQEVARDLHAQASEGAWITTQPWDEHLGIALQFKRTDYDTLLDIQGDPGSQAQRIGMYQRAYGWLSFPGVWRKGNLPLKSGHVLFSRVQFYEVVR